MIACATNEGKRAVDVHRVDLPGPAAPGDPPHGKCFGSRYLQASGCENQSQPRRVRIALGENSHALFALWRRASHEASPAESHSVTIRSTNTTPVRAAAMGVLACASVVLHSYENLNDSPGSNVLSAMALESACASSPRDCVER